MGLRADEDANDEAEKKEEPWRDCHWLIYCLRDMYAPKLAKIPIKEKKCKVLAR